MEGADNIISKGKVSRKENEIFVDFARPDISVKNKKLPFSFRIDKSTLVISLKKAGSLKYFSIKNPSRIVMDVYHDSQASIKKEEKKKKRAQKEVKKKIKKEDIKTAKKVTKKEKEKEVNKLTKKNTGSVKEKTDKQDIDNKENEILANSKAKDKENDSFIPEQYKGLWSLLQAGNFYAVLKELPNFKPTDMKSLAAYHYMYGDAYRTAREYLTAIGHLRLAYIYAIDETLKERALFERAELYQKLGLVYEARANYIVFIRNFPSSLRIEDAHLGLAETLSKMQMYGEAIEHYRKAGNTPKILFSKANALQRIGKVSEARRAYANALSIDRRYPSKSAETYYFIGENMRMLGELKDANKHLRLLNYGKFKDSSRISLGHIAMEQEDFEEAITNYKVASRSRERKVRVEGLFNLSRAYKKLGKIQEAISSLEIIRHDYINSALYKDTLLELAKLYKKEGNLKYAMSLLKELVYGKQPPREAFEELESILIEASKKNRDGSDDVQFLTLWNEVGQWLIDETREEFLLKVSEILRYEGKPFLELASWLVENGSKNARMIAAIDLADYYIGIGNVEHARKYMNRVYKARVSNDASLRVEAKILRSTGNYKQALKKIMLIKKPEDVDLDAVGNIISGLKKSEERLKAVAFYERVLNSSDWDAKKYNRIADILYTNDEKGKALKYYRIAYEKKPEDEWTAYRIGHDGSMNESKEIFGRMEKGDTLLSRLAKTRLIEIDLINKVKEVY